MNTHPTTATERLKALDAALYRRDQQLRIEQASPEMWRVCSRGVTQTGLQRGEPLEVFGFHALRPMMVMFYEMCKAVM